MLHCSMERKCKNTVIVYDAWNDILAEIMRTVRNIGIQQQLFKQESSLKNVDTHTCQTAITSGYGFRIMGFFFESHEPLMLIDRHDAKLFGVFHGNGQCGNRQICFVFPMKINHRLVVHFVNMIAGDD